MAKSQSSMSVARIKHGWHGTPTYKAWENMKQRCTENRKSPYFKNYGARGITYASRWKTFLNFLRDMGEKPSGKLSLDREDNNGNYCKSNCRWATPCEQQNNRQDNHLLLFAGKRLTIREWEIELGYPIGTIRIRIFRNWTVERALQTPHKPKRKTNPRG